MNIFLFHRDFRLIDNTSLIAQIKKLNKKIIPTFIFTPQQINPKINKYFSSNSVQFMIESLKDLNKQVEDHNGKVYYFYGKNLEIKINSIAFNLDYTPYAKKRDREIMKWAEERNIEVIAKEDYGLYDLFEVDFMGKNGSPPTFTPFKQFCYENLTVKKPDDFEGFQFEVNKQLENLYLSYNFQKQASKLYDSNEKLALRGGREQALKILTNLKNFKNYFQDRNYPALPATRLSPYLHFTPISVRQVYHNVVKCLGLQHHLIFQLHCRQFFTYVCHRFPHVLQDEKSKNLKPEFNQMKWNENSQALKRWKEGTTGVPFVDAGIRQMNQTGYMHNRTRQNVACFLVKDLRINWQEGEQYFAQKLVDYSATQNSGNWQYVAGVGTDPMETRVFNPYLQAEKYDPNCQYIKKWIPELEQVPCKDILRWDRSCKEYIKKGINYPEPIVDHDLQTQQTINQYKKLLKNNQNKPHQHKKYPKFQNKKQSQKYKQKSSSQNPKPKKIIYKEKIVEDK